MKVGTKSLLFGVHQFLWHPLCVWRAYRHLYREAPTFWQTLAILMHDWGYWGCENIDGLEGKQHPYRGAMLVQWLYFLWHVRLLRDNSPERAVAGHKLFTWTAFHSRSVASIWLCEPSKLCWADKASLWFEPRWFYLLRARLSGEVLEFRKNAEHRVPRCASDSAWYVWLVAKTQKEVVTALGDSLWPRYEKIV